MSSWRDFQTRDGRLALQRRRRSVVNTASAAPTAARESASAPAPPLAVSNETTPDSRPRNEPYPPPPISALVSIIGWIVTFWEAVGLIALMALIRAMDWQGATGMWLGIGYLVLVHWYGIRHARGPSLAAMWATLFLAALLMSGGRSGESSDGSGCEWGRYGQPC